MENEKLLPKTLAGNLLVDLILAANDVASDGTIAFTISDPQWPADVAMVKNNRYKTLTQLNEDALGHKDIMVILVFS